MSRQGNTESIKWWECLLVAALSGCVAVFSMHHSYLRCASTRGDVETGAFGAILSALVKRIEIGEGMADTLSGLTWGDLLISIGIFAVLMGIGFSLLTKKDRWLYRVYRRRRWIGGAILVFCVVFELHNSSLYLWSNYLQGAENNGPLWGRAQMIRSDEWAVWTPFAISQSYNGYAAVNNQIAGGGIDAGWISVGGIPALNSALLFKPFYWGFLLLDTARGLSFLCNIRWMMLLGVSFACAKRYTGNNLALSLAAAALLTWSPYVQWWYSQSIAEVLIFGQLIPLCLDAYIRQTKGKNKWLLSIGLAYSLGCYVMIAYPSWLISGMYVIAGAVLWLIVKNRKKLNRKDAIRLLLPLATTAAYLGMVVYQSRDTLQAVANSVYPGERLVTGGSVDASFFTGLYALFFPFLSPYANYSELAGFISFAPAGLLLTLYRLLVLREKDTFAQILLGIEAFFGIFLLVGVPETFAKATLLSQCTRVQAAVAMADIMLLFRGLAGGSIRSSVTRWGFTLLSVAVNAAALWKNHSIPPGILILLVLLNGVIFSLIYHHRRENARMVAFSLVCVMLMAGGFVNPIQKGLDCVTELELVKTLKQMDDNDALYAFEGDWPVTNAPLLAGKRCWNSTQAYANINRWEKLDPSGDFQSVYNRFCHMSLRIEETQNAFELLNADHIKVSLTGSDLPALGIDYLITAEDYSDGLQGCQLILKETADNYNIYEVKP